MTWSSTASAAVAFPVAALGALVASFVLVQRLERLAGRLGLSEAMLGLVVALAADAPEITSAVTASARGNTSVGAGVVLGSNVFNLAALLGLGVIVARRIFLHRKVVILEGIVAIWVAVVTLAVVAAGAGAIAGLLLVLVVVGVYIVVSALSPARLQQLGLPPRLVSWLDVAIDEEELELAAGIRPAESGRRDVLVGAVSLMVVVGASIVMERTAETIGRHFHLSDLVIGGLILAAVTSLPNAVGAVFLATRGRGAAFLSEAMNSNMLNVVIGLLLPSVFFGLSGATGPSTLVAAWYFGLTVLSLLMAYAGKGLNRREGALIIVAYLAFVVVAATAV
jgi:cation:H+ antiporter